MTDKVTIRQEMRARRKALSPEAKARAAGIVCDKILSHSNVHAALDPFDGWGSLAVYLASPDEIDLTASIEEMLALGVTVVAPRWNGEAYELAKLKSLKDEDLRKGPMGILEPKDADIVPPKGVAVWLVPGLAFTRDGKRLGYGGGWYDRLMAGTAKGAMKIGVAHAFQVVEDLPSEPHDVKLDEVIDDSLEHPQVDYTELPDGCRVHVSIAHRRRWWTAFFGGFVGVSSFPVLIKRLGGRGREQTFSMASYAPHSLQDSRVSLIDTAGEHRTLFDDLPPHCYLYLEQFIRQEMEGRVCRTEGES